MKSTWTQRLIIDSVSKQVASKLVIDKLSLTITKGSVTAIIGPNGSGKSTLLQIIANLLKPDEGNVLKFVENDKQSFMFQNYRASLLPWRTCYENVSLPLEILQCSKQDIADQIELIKKMFETNFDFLTYPEFLSGGQQQVVALMRSLINKPDLLILDEPFSALDLEYSLRLRNSLERYYLISRPTIIFVTHNLDEAIQLADNIILLSKSPARVKAIFTVPFDRPRRVNNVHGPTLLSLKDELERAFLSVVND
jgi:NitT/TauT family transport system ATP-binding protein